MLRWLRRLRQLDDQHLVKGAAPLPVDPIEELARVVSEGQERDAVDERRLYHPISSRRWRKGRRPR